ncbi:MAG: LPS-assembly protein LptD [Rhodobiaceae bacterium]|nr:LPS-assembly protein LptD [Rhodobiaceae bacterium]MCC0056502.1 LPS-assembly protein LptD [Rhodobiaceae bacterium]
MDQSPPKGRLRVLGALGGIAAGLIFCVALAAPVAAQNLLPSTLPGNPRLVTDPNAQMLVEADQMVYDYDNEVVTAKGNVQIYYDGRTLEADEVSYAQRTRKLTASGGVKITEPAGNVIYAENMTLTDDFRDGFVRSLTVVTPDKAYFTAASAERQEGNITIFNKGTYTACEPCKEHPEKPPTWRIRASRIVHDQQEKVVYYEKARFEFFGIPIAAVPYFSHADPTVKRKSGFLLPSLISSDQLGFGAEIPYFFNLAPNYDVTLTAVPLEKQGLLGKLQWRHRVANGSYNITVTGIDQTNPLLFAPATIRKARGSLESQGRFVINKMWSWGWDLTLVSDETYLRTYKMTEDTERKSQIYLTGLGERSYFNASAKYYKLLTTTTLQQQQAIVHPVVDYNYVFADPVFGGQLRMNANMLSLSRETAAFDPITTSKLCNTTKTTANCRLQGAAGQYNRFLTQVEWEKRITTANGQVITPYLSARGDLYSLDIDSTSNGANIASYMMTGQNTFGRGMATAAVEWRWPFIVSDDWGFQIFEPIAQLILRPNEARLAYVPNEDAQSIVFDDTILFDYDKFSGYDRIEGGSRANVGLKYTLQTKSGKRIRGVFGQSFHLAGVNPFPIGSGLETDRSDYVAAGYLDLTQKLTIASRFRLDEKDFDLQRLDLGATYTGKFISGSLTYSNIAPVPLIGYPLRREEIQTKGKLQLTDRWSTFGGIRYDLDGQQWVSNSLGLGYDDGCFAIALTYERQYVRDGDVAPDETIYLKVRLRTLGEQQVNQSIADTK